MIRARTSFLVILAVTAASHQTAAQDITSGLRGHWRLLETSGTTATDTTSTAQNGTYTGGVALAASVAVPSDGAIPANFNGSSHYVTMASHSDLQPTTALTIAGWVRGDAWGSGTDNDTILRKGENNPNNWALAISDGRVELILDGNDNAGFKGNTTLSTGVWYHVAATWNGSQIRIYVNGVLDNTPASHSGTIGADTRAAYIGGRAGTDYFDGGLYDVRLYNRALSAADISALYTQTGLVGHWKLNQTSGTTATDSSPYANHGTYTNGVTLASAGPYPGAGDKAGSFDGVNDYVNTANDYYYDITGPITVGAWIKVNSFTFNSQTIVSKGNTAWRLQRNGTTNQVQFVCNGLSTTTVNTVSDLNDGRWHFVVGTYDGSTLAIYVDGVLDASVAATGVIVTNNFVVRIGENAETTGRYWNGGVHDVCVYSVALTASQVAQLYGFIGHWTLNHASGATASDSTVFAKHGTVSGAANWSTDCAGTRVFDFNGTNNYISTTNASHLQPTSAVTIAAWVKGDYWGAGGDADTILRKGEAGPNNYSLAISDGRVELLLDGNDASGWRGNTVLSTGQWYHVAAVWEGATVRVFVNGVLDNSPPARTGTINTDTRPLYIGGRSGADLFDGMVRDVRLYNRALYDQDIKKLAAVSGDWQFSEGTGATAADSSGQGNNAILSGGASWTTDCAGNNNALLTNGAGGIAQTAGPVDPPDVGTVAFWMRSTGAPAGTARILGLGGDWEIRQNNDGRVISDLCGDGSTTIGTVTPLTEVGRWYHVAATFDSTNDTYAIYVDGQLELSGTNPNDMVKQPAGVLSFGTRTGSTEYWSGALRDVRIYARKLCPTEIATLYGLGGHWKLDETSGSVAADSSGLGRHGTVVGTANWVAGKIDNSLQLNGATRVEINSLIGSPKNVTLAAWANLTTPDSSGAEIVSLGDYFAIRLDNSGTTRTFFYNGTNWTSVSVNQTFAGTGWHHFAAVFNDDRDYCKLFIDGLEVASSTTTVTIPYGALGTMTVVGAHGNGQTSYDFNGKLDDVRIYTRALCPADIQALHDLGSGGFGGVKIIKWVEIQ